MLKFLSRLLLIAALCVPWATQAQGLTLSEYEFRTGVDNDSSVWMTLTNPTTLLGNGTYVDDSPVSSITNIGFDFTLGEDSYSQFWVNANGMFSFSPSTTTTTTAGQFTSSYYSTALPKIIGIARDMSTGSNGYIKYELMGTAPERVLVCEFALSYTFGSSYAGDVKWQIQLHEDSNKVVIVYGPAPTTTPSSFQSGIGVTSSDIVILNPSTHNPTYLSSYHSTTYSTWHGAGRYYEFVPPVITCPKPTNLHVVDVSTDEFTIAWSRGGEEQSTEVTLGNNTYITTDTFYTFSNLTENTLYNYSVRAICGVDDTSFYTVGSCRTLCTIIDALPFVYGFEDAASGTSADFPYCWRRINDATSTYNYYPYVSTTAYHGSKSLYWYMSTTSSYASNEYLVFPAIDNSTYSTNGMLVSFMAAASSPTYHPVFVAGVMTSNSDTSTFVAVDTIRVEGNIWNPYDVSFANYSGPEGFLAIKAFRPASAWYCYMDDITVSQGTCRVPANVIVSDPTTDGFTLSWDAQGGTEFAVMLNDSVVAVVSTPSYTFTDLSFNTLYEYGVATVCNGDTTQYYYGTTRTACSVLGVDDLPYTYGFEDLSTGSTSSTEFVPCWERVNTSSSLYPYVNSTAHQSSRALYWYTYTSSSYADNPIICLPEFDTTEIATNTLELMFWAEKTSVSYHPWFEVGVYVQSGNNAEFFPVDTVNDFSASSVWEEIYVNYSNYTGPAGRLAIRFSKANSTTSYDYANVYLDDFTMRVASSCAMPADLSVNSSVADSIVVSWTDGNATAWQIAVGGQGFDPDTLSDYVSATDNSYVFDDLPSGIAYEVYVRADCGGTYSYWLGPVAFTPGSVNMGVTGSATMYVCNAVIYDDGGATGQYSNSCDYTLTLYPNDETKRFKFWGSGNTEANYDYLRIYAGTAAAGTPLGSIEGSDVTIDTVLTQGGPITLHFHSDGSVVYDGFELHIMCDDLPACRDIENVTVEEVSTSSAYVTWENVIGNTPLPSSYIVNVYDSTNTVVSTTTTTDMFAIVGGLDDNTDYTVTVVPSCDDANGSPSGTTFTTAGFGCLQIDATLTFSDTIGNGTTTNNYLPSYSFYNYGMSQQIYTAAEIGHGGQINSIAFMMNTVTQQRTYEIYMGHVNVATASSYLNPADLTCVYNGGAVTMTADQWTTFTLTTPFNYNGTDNLLVVFRDMTGSYVSGNYGYVHSAPSGAAMYSYQDSGPYTPGTGSGTSLSYRNNIILAGAPCAVEATCAAPLLVVSNVTEQSVDLTWAAGASESSWTVEHKADGDVAWTVDLANTSVTNYTVTNLLPNTRYQFRVYHMCGTDTFATVRNALTACVGASVPFFEDFSTWSTGSSAAVPSCWFKGSDYSSGYPYVTTGYSMGTDNKSMYFYASGTTFTYLTLPKFADPLDTLVVTGYVYYSSNGYNLNVGYMTDPEDASTFHPVSGVSTVANTWVPFEVVYAGQPDGYIAFGTGNGGSYSYLYLDNVEVNYFNPCIRPTNVTDSASTLSSVYILWNDTAATEFEVEYGPAGFQQGQGTTVFVSGDNSVQLTGLNHSTLYNVYVRGICGVGDTGSWSFVHTFHTECSMIDAFPYTENFNNWGTGSSVHAPLCWTYGSQYSTTYPYISSSYSHNTSGGSMYMYVYDNGGSNGYMTWFALPELDVTVANANQIELTFYSYASTSSYEQPIYVGVGDNSTLDATVVWLDTVYPTYSEWTEHGVVLSNYTGTGHYIFFASNTGGDSYTYPYIDDINVEMIRTCLRPENLYAQNATQNSVTVGWTEMSTATSWMIEYGPAGFTRGTGTSVLANTNPFTLTGLTPDYEGEFYVRAICGAGDTSYYSRTSCIFSTSQIPATVPYSYNFESADEWANWGHSTNVANKDWYRGTAVAHGGSYSMYVSADAGATYRPYTYTEVLNAAVYRDVDFGNIDTSFTISFDARVGGTLSNNYDGLMVFLVDPVLGAVASNSNITTPWGNVNDLYRIATIRRDTSWNTYSASFDDISGVKRVAFFWFNQNTESSYPNYGEPAAVDNLVIDYSPCPRPTQLVANESMNSAVLSWHGAASATYEVAYREYTNGTNQFLYTNTNSITINGLDSLTEYVFWVRKICGVDDTSLWSDGRLFTTHFCNGQQTIPNYGPASVETTSTYAPIGYSFYNYGYVQTLIDASYFAGLSGDITSFAFVSTVATAGDYYDNMTMWMANVPESDLSGGTIIPDDSVHVFVPVISDASFSYTTAGTHMFAFDSAFTWDGHSNVLVAVKRDHGVYTSGATFSAHKTANIMTRYYYQDSGPISPESPSASNSGTGRYTGDLIFYTCGGCGAPAIVLGNYDYAQATVAWTGSAETYEYAYKAVSDATWPEATTTTAFNQTITGLQPSTTYQFRIRAICDVENEMISDWAMVTFTTDSLPCFAPSNVEVDAQGQQAVVSWTAGGNETQWVVRVYNTTFDQEYTATTNPYTVTGLTANVTYNVTVSSLCGNGAVQSEWTEPVSFTTVPCDPVTNVQVTGITTTTANVSWTAGANNTGSWKVDWNYHGASVGSSGSVTVNTTSAQLTGLTAGAEYDVSVSAICAAGYESNYTTQTFTTTVGIASVEDGMSLSIYPNPATGNTTITLSGVNGNVTLSVIDMSGRTVKTTTMECSGDCQQVINVDNLAAGAYFVRVYGDNVNTVKKLIVK